MSAAPPRRKLVHGPPGARHLVETSLYKPIVSICDYVGLSQHMGECWVDTIQQIFFFTDGLKELTQPLFYNLTDAKLREYMHKAVAAGIFSDDILTPKAAAAAPAAPPAAPAAELNATPNAKPANEAPAVKPPNSPIIEAVKDNDLATVTRLLEADPSSIETVDAEGNTLLITAVVRDYDKMIELLLSKGANIDAKGPLEAAIVLNKYSIINLLLEKGATIYENAFQLALRDKSINEAIIQLLLNKGYNINAVDEYGMTALMNASRDGKDNAVRVLLKFGANVNLKDIDNMTALDIAMNEGNAKIVELLHAQMKSANNKNNVFNASAIKPVVEEAVGVKTMLSIYEGGIKAIRDRFKNHYDVIVYNKEAECVAKGPQQIRKMYLASVAGRTLFKRLESKRLGVAAAAGTQDKNKQQARLNSGGKYTEENAGGTLMQQLAISNILYRMFDLPFRAMQLVTGLASKAPIHALGIGMIHIKGRELFGGHATGFLQCKDKWYYYNDNTGLFAVSANLVTALQTALNFNDGLEHPSICIKTVKERCYLLKLNNVRTVYKYETYGFGRGQTVIGDFTPAMIWTETDWIDYTTWKISHKEEASEIQPTMITTYNVLTSAYCVVKYELDQASTIFNNAIRINDAEYFKTIEDDVKYDPLEVLKEALRYKSDNIANYIISKYPDTNLNTIIDSEGITVLMFCILENFDSVKLMYLLKNEKVNINIQDTNGMTALMHAVVIKDWGKIWLILENHPNLNLKNKDDKTAFDLAKELKNEEIIKLIEDAMKAAAAPVAPAAPPPAGGRRRIRTRKGRRNARNQSRRRR